MDLVKYHQTWQSNHRLLKMAQPAGWWRDAFPLGNGHLGAMPYGRLCEERILINHEKLWYGGIVPELPDLADLLPKSRELIEQGEALAANELYHDALKAEGKEGRCAVYHPAADLRFSSVCEERFKNYQRYLDLEAGETMTYWEWHGQAQVRRSFVSRADDCIVVEQLGSGVEALSWELNLELHELMDAIRHNGELFKPAIDFTATADGEWLIGTGKYTDPNYDGAEYGVVARVVASETSCLSPGEAGKSIVLNGAEDVRVIAKVFVYEPSEAAVERLKQEIVALGADYDALLQRHSELHRPQFDACRIEFADTGNSTNEALLLDAYSGSTSNELLQKMTDYGRYLLMGSSDEGSVPSNLQGIWNGDYAPPWDCFFMINENLLMNYWQALPGGMNAEALGVFNFYESNLEAYRENAQKLYGCRGIFIPALTSPETGLSTHGGSWIVNWISGAGWLCQLFYDYYLFSGDAAFLKDRLLPFMREVAIFYEDYFTYDAAGQVVISPSTSPENWPKESCAIKSPSSIHPRMTVNATMDVAIARELLGNLLKGARDFGLYEESLEQWECMLEGLPEYEINEDGAIREWLDHRFSDNYEHRHLSQIYPVFPGFEVTEESHPTLFPAFKTAVDKRGTVGLKDQTGWSLAHMANIRARMGDGANAYDCLETLMQTCVGKNLFTYHNDYRGSGISIDWFFGRSTPFQIDANMGLTAAVYEMLVQSSPGRIKLLPALPEQLASGRLRGVRTRAAVTVDMEWQLDQEPSRVQCRFESLVDQVVTVQLPKASMLMSGDAIHVQDTTCYNVKLQANTPLEVEWELVEEAIHAVNK
ncbi:MULTISPECIES: glycosyl hydrolase family 95 catalytic domain-containing protein [unclassified Lentimonas]|uniref:glycosyl hydrolase family 95 catalytic domain-containing protein n=1 Tax=unclassified Lentimonas TaxID=2630993 RepID=UPI00132B7353|nr:MULTISPECIES: glycoside hydrolase N-terminal domain-containing protein [unclassified Lentimonas]CAA6691297.1 putative large secreted protein [Lentimonas sp. CC10]CAA6695924.1 putative large secreted protein [Lentimonas sp. CC19]CAA7068672.1 putative large secreted protein [Lentimonas sp. CC11]